MKGLLAILHGLGIGMGFILVGILCLAGIMLSCLSLSGTWLVVAAAFVAAILRSDAFPGIWTVLAFVIVAAIVEIVEAFAGIWGVKRMGGSKLGGVAALVGGLLGMVLGTSIPVPLVGNLLGMVLGSFALVFAVEYYHFHKAGVAAGVAWGTVVGRAVVLLLKVTATLGMIAYLLLGIII